ncbi:PD-(D/E)XK nuclease family transposase [Treponema sp. R80B11-R83G3]
MDFKILPPTDDWIFKLLFGDERNKSMLIDLLKAFVELPQEEYELSFLDTSLGQAEGGI